MPSTSVPSFRVDRVRIVPWPDAVVDEVGHDPRSAYTERFWLGILGPATTLLLRQVAAGLDRHPDGYWMDIEVTARSLGLVATSRHSPFMRSLTRCCTFGMAYPHDASMIAVRRRLPPLSPGQVSRLPDELAREHEQWSGVRVPAHAVTEDRIEELAATLLQLGETVEETDAQLARWHVEPDIRQRALYTAWERMQVA